MLESTDTWVDDPTKLLTQRPVLPPITAKLMRHWNRLTLAQRQNAVAQWTLAVAAVISVNRNSPQPLVLAIVSLLVLMLVSSSVRAGGGAGGDEDNGSAQCKNCSAAASASSSSSCPGSCSGAAASASRPADAQTAPRGSHLAGSGEAYRAPQLPAWAGTSAHQWGVERSGIDKLFENTQYSRPYNRPSIGVPVVDNCMRVAQDPVTMYALTHGNPFSLDHYVASQGTAARLPFNN